MTPLPAIKLAQAEACCEKSVPVFFTIPSLGLLFPHWATSYDVWRRSRHIDHEYHDFLTINILLNQTGNGRSGDPYSPETWRFTKPPPEARPIDPRETVANIRRLHGELCDQILDYRQNGTAIGPMIPRLRLRPMFRAFAIIITQFPAAIDKSDDEELPEYFRRMLDTFRTMEVILIRTGCTDGLHVSTDWSKLEQTRMEPITEDAVFTSMDHALQFISDLQDEQVDAEISHTGVDPYAVDLDAGTGFARPESFLRGTYKIDYYDGPAITGRLLMKHRDLSIYPEPIFGLRLYNHFKICTQPFEEAKRRLRAAQDTSEDDSFCNLTL